MFYCKWIRCILCWIYEDTLSFVQTTPVNQMLLLRASHSFKISFSHLLMLIQQKALMFFYWNSLYTMYTSINCAQINTELHEMFKGFFSLYWVLGKCVWIMYILTKSLKLCWKVVWSHHTIGNLFTKGWMKHQGQSHSIQWHWNSAETTVQSFPGKKRSTSGLIILYNCVTELNHLQC